MSKGILYIQKEKYRYELFNEGIRLKNKKEDQFIPISNIFSIRKIKLYKWELITYSLVTLIAFTFYWIIGVIFVVYTFAQYIANLRVVLLTEKGQIILKFNSDDEKEKFAKDLRKIYPEGFKMKKWFQFRKESE